MLDDQTELQVEFNSQEQRLREAQKNYERMVRVWRHGKVINLLTLTEIRSVENEERRSR